MENKTITRQFRVPRAAAGALAAIGIGVLIGWAVNFEPLMTILPGLIRMKPNTAIAFLLASAALFSEYEEICKPARIVFSSLIVAIGFITLCEYVFSFNGHIDQLLFRDPIPSPAPGRMAHITAANFLLSGLMLYPFNSRLGQKFRDSLAVVICFISTFAIVGYLYGVPLLYGSVHYTAMAIHTGFCFIFLSVGFLFVQKKYGFGRIFQAQTAGGIVARRLIPPAIFIPIILGGVFVHFNFGQLRLGIALIVMCNVLLAVTSIWSLAHVLNRSEVKRGRAQEAAEKDALTGIHNRRYFDMRLREEILRCVRHDRRSCLILFDVDHFKNLNDRFGHQAGDKVLSTIAQNCRKTLRATDIICRYGGEEFAVIAPETDSKDGLVLAKKLRTMVGLLRFDEIATSVTISLGVASIDRTAPTPELAIAAADEALYSAKKLGRNREILAIQRNIELIDS